MKKNIICWVWLSVLCWILGAVSSAKAIEGTLTFSSASINEGQSVVGTIRVAQSFPTPQTLQIWASFVSGARPGGDPFEYYPERLLKFPVTVVLPAGRNQLTFPIGALEDRIAFGSRLKVQFHLSGRDTNFSIPPQILNLVDNDAPRLELVFERDNLISEPSGGRTKVRIIANASLRDLTTFPSGFGRVPPKVIISDPSLLRAGSVRLESTNSLTRSTAQFTLYVPPELRLSEPRSVTIAVQIYRFPTATRTLIIRPATVPSLKVMPQSVVVGEDETSSVTVMRTGDLSRALEVGIFCFPLRKIPADDSAPQRARFEPNVARITVPIRIASDGFWSQVTNHVVVAQAEGYREGRTTLTVRNIEPMVQASVSSQTLIEGRSPSRGILKMRLSQPYSRDVTLTVNRRGDRLRFDGTREPSREVTLPRDGSLLEVPFVLANDTIVNFGTEAFGFLQPFAQNSFETEAEVGIADDEGLLALNASPNRLRPSFLSNQFETVRVTVQLLRPQTQPLEVKVTFDSWYLPAKTVTFAPGITTQIFDIDLPRNNRGGTSNISAYANAQGRTFSTNFPLQQLPFPENLRIGENGPPVSRYLQRDDATRVQTFILTSDDTSRLQVLDARITFAVGQSIAPVRVQAVNNNIIDPIENFDDDDSPGVRILIAPDGAYWADGGDVLIEDDELRARFDAMPVSRAVITRANPTLFNDSGLPNAQIDLSFSTPIYLNGEFFVTLNGVPLGYYIEALNPNPSGAPQFRVRLHVSDARLRPGARLEIVPIGVVDSAGDLLVPRTTSVVLPSFTRS